MNFVINKALNRVRTASSTLSSRFDTFRRMTTDISKRKFACWIFFSLGLASLSFSSPQDSKALTGFTEDRYTNIWKKNPFVRSSAPVEEATGLAVQYSVAGFSEPDLVILIDKTSQKRVVVKKGESNSQGLSVVSVQPSEKHSKASIVIKKGDEQATIQMDETLVANAGNGGGGMMPGMPPMMNPMSSGMPRPQQTFIPPPAQPQIQPNPLGANTQRPQPVQRRRIIVPTPPAQKTAPTK
jgi:hypothetical protein